MRNIFAAVAVAIWMCSAIAADTSKPLGLSSHVQTAAEVEQDLWDNIKGSSDPAVFEAYLGEYPHGHFAPMARVLITKLKSPSSSQPFSSAPDSTVKIPIDAKYPKSIINYSDGNRFEGTLIKGNRVGQGKFYWASDGTRYEGEFTNDEITGRGKLIWTDGEHYEGDVKNGMRHGQGIMFMANGQRYEGEFRNGDANGQGKLFYPNGNRYEGEFKNGITNGRGTIYYANDKVEAGLFQNGIKVSQ